MITQDLLKKIEKTNKELDKIRAKGNVPITNHSFYQETYNRVLKPVGTKGSGRIMSYAEANKRYQKYFPGETLSEETYAEDVESLLFTGGERLTEKGEEEYQRERMESTIEDARNYSALPFDFDVSKLSTDELKEAFYEAQEEEENRGWKRGTDDSYRFYGVLLEKTNEIYQAKYGI